MRGEISYQSLIINMKKPKIKIEKNKDLIKKDLIIELDHVDMKNIGRIFVHSCDKYNSKSSTHFIQL